MRPPGPVFIFGCVRDLNCEGVEEKPETIPIFFLVVDVCFNKLNFLEQFQMYRKAVRDCKVPINASSVSRSSASHMSTIHLSQ